MKHRENKVIKVKYVQFVAEQPSQLQPRPSAIATYWFDRKESMYDARESRSYMILTGGISGLRSRGGGGNSTYYVMGTCHFARKIGTHNSVNSGGF